jgi:hypothetical protein
VHDQQSDDSGRHERGQNSDRDTGERAGHEKFDGEPSAIHAQAEIGGVAEDKTPV